MPSFDPRPQHEALLPGIKAAFDQVVASGHFIGGEFVEAFERDFAAAVGVPHAAAVSSGTDALLVTLMALGVGPGDLVLTTPFTFFATAGAIRRLGARPVFADVDPRTLNLCPERAADALARRAPGVPAGRFKAILPVHLYGRAAALTAFLDLAGRAGAELVEDVAQALGARLDGHPVGGFGRAGCFSFYPTKNLGGLGDGGAVATRDAALDRRIKALRNHGQGAGSNPYEHELLGGNFRLDALQCAALRVKLPHLGRWNQERIALARRYAEGLRAHGVTEQVRLPDFGPDGGHVFHQFVVRAERRDELRAFLRERGIGSAIYYPIPLHLQPCFRDLGHRVGDFPETERAAAEVLALPIHPGLPPAAVDQVVDAIAAFVRG